MDWPILCEIRAGRSLDLDRDGGRGSARPREVEFELGPREELCVVAGSCSSNRLAEKVVVPSVANDGSRVSVRRPPSLPSIAIWMSLSSTVRSIATQNCNL